MHLAGIWLLATAGIVAVLAILVALIGVSVEWEWPKFKRSSERNDRWQAPAAISAVCLVLAAIGGPLYSTAANDGRTAAHRIQAGTARAALRFSDPVTTRSYMPTLYCQDNIEVAGNLPAGDTVVIGNAILGSTDISFVADAIPAGQGLWQAHIYLGGKQDAGAFFTLYAMAMSSAWADYIKGWTAVGLPPPPALLLAQERVRRSRSSAGC